jgi:hypothetical protein
MTTATRELTIDDFSRRVGKTVEAQAGGQRVALVVHAVQELPSSGRQGGAFRLEFMGPLNPMLGQGMFPFLIGRERFDIFIVPVSRDQRGVCYEAVFY